MLLTIVSLKWKVFSGLHVWDIKDPTGLLTLYFAQGYKSILQPSKPDPKFGSCYPGLRQFSHWHIPRLADFRLGLAGLSPEQGSPLKID